MQSSLVNIWIILIETEFWKINFFHFPANFIMFSHGCILGWVSTALLLLTSEDTPLKSGPVTLEQLSWIGSMHCIGAMFGTFTFGCFTSFMGCKRTMAFLGIPAICYWLTIMYGHSVHYIIFARFLAGWTGGGIFSITVLYVAEIADDKWVDALSCVNEHRFWLFWKLQNTRHIRFNGTTLQKCWHAHCVYSKCVSQLRSTSICVHNHSDCVHD